MLSVIFHKDHPRKVPYSEATTEYNIERHGLTLNLAEFFKWNNPPSIYGTVHYNLKDIKIRTSQYRAWFYTGSKD